MRIGLLVSSLLLSLYVMFVPGSEAVALGGYSSDHYSHYGTTILFWHRGFAIYDTPVRSLCDPPGERTRAFAREHSVFEPNLCELRERGDARPLIINWADYPRPYPPGQLLFTAPEALLYAHTTASWRAINRFTIVKNIVVAHMLVGLVLAMLVGGPPSDQRELWRSLGFVLVPLVYLATIPWAMAGFYDAIAIAGVVMGVGRMRDGKPVGALAWLTLASFLHFRATWYAPLGIVCLHALRTQRAELATTRGRLLLVGALLLFAGSVVPLSLVAPFLSTFPESNSAYLARGLSSPAALNLVILVSIVAGALISQRQWLLLALVGWQGLLIGLTVQVQHWHAMFLIPLLPIARWQNANLPTLATILMFIVGITEVVFNGLTVAGSFAYYLLRGVI